MARRGVFGLLLAGAVLATALGLSGCSTAEDPWEKVSGGPPRVVVTFPPLACFVKNVGKEHVGVITLCSLTGPHDYEYNVRDARYLRRADLFLLNGLSLDENFSKKLLANSGNPKLVFLEVGEKIPENLLRHTVEVEKKGEKKDHGHGHEHGEHDPHVWLGVPQACAMVNVIRDELKKIDPAHAKEYDANAKAYVKELEALRKEYRDKFLKKDNRKIISFHDSMRYVEDGDKKKGEEFESYGVKIVGVIEKKPGEDLSAGEMAELVEIYKEHNPKPRVITFEPQYSRKAAEAVLAELEKRTKTNDEIKLVEFDPLETADPNDELKPEDPAWYVTKMRKNLEAIYQALP